ncbi:MAG: PH domain-containing protein [Terrimicrobiaceae bacterium]|nr:PH domain-containing protein [Terrimicrobiaceae bacterium]
MPDEAAPSPAHPAESVLWKGHTSQWVHFWYYFFCVLLAAAALGGIPFTGGLSAIGLVIPAGMWIVRWWTNRATVYELTTQRLRITRGILNRRLDEIELYRVKDYVMEQPLLLRLLGLGNVTILTSDVSTPTVAIRAIAGVEAMREKLRAAVQSERDRKRVRELDVDDPADLH